MLPIHADFFELVEKCVGFAQVLRITELPDQIGGPHQQTLFFAELRSIKRGAAR
jgi:hypothetical protein